MYSRQVISFLVVLAAAPVCLAQNYYTYQNGRLVPVATQNPGIALTPVKVKSVTPNMPFPIQDEKKNGKNGDDKNGKNGDEKNGKDDKEDKDKDDKDKDKKECPKPPKSIFEWKIGKEEEKKEGEEEEEEEDEIVTDRPDFTEASSTVGRGRIQVESGYTYSRNKSGGETTRVHSYPETLIRIGMFAEWFEFRIAQTFLSENVSSSTGRTKVRGADDLYLGAKLALTEQKEYLPEMAIVLQATVPTGHREFTSDRILPGFNYLYGWDVIKDCISMGGSFGMNKNQDGLGHYYWQWHQSFTVGYTLTEKIGAYTEFFSFHPLSSIDPFTLPQYYFNGGFTYKPTKLTQFDVRAGVGLNRHADDFFIGAGYSFKF